MKYLLDTKIISEVAKPRPNGKVLNWLQQHEGNCGVPGIAVAERFQGAFAQPDPARKRTLLADIRCLLVNYGDRIIPFDAKAAEVWGEYVNRDCVRLKPRPYPDTQIAAIALSRDLMVVTRDTSDFPEVPTVNPFAD